MVSSPKARKLYQLRVGRGQPATVPIDRVRAHLEHLNSLGITNQMIAHAADVHVQAINHMHRRNTVHTRIDVARRIFAIDHRPHPRQLTVPALGARRRIRALNALGWPTEELAHRLGQSTRHVLNLAIAKPTMTYGLWARIRDLYELLSGTPGPSETSARVAKRNHHLPPLAWEGRDIDHPHTQPDWAAAGIKRADRPVCRNGHPRNRENLIRDHRGHRACRICLNEQKRRELNRRKQAS